MEQLELKLPTPISCDECESTKDLYQCNECCEYFCKDHLRKFYEFCEKWDGYNEDYCCDEFPTNHIAVGYAGSCECKELL